MNKSDIIKEIAGEIKFQKGKSHNMRIAKIAVETIIENLKKALLRDEKIEIRGFGSFAMKYYNAYKGKNPKTKEAIHVKPKRLPHFKVGKELKEMISNSFKEGRQ